MDKPITVFCAFTRRWALDKWLEDLSNISHDPELTNLCFIIDTYDIEMQHRLEFFAEASKYRSLHIRMNENWEPNEVKQSVRRPRIAEIHNQSKALIAKTDGDLVIGFEDDTVFERLESFDKLLEPLRKFPDVGFVEGVQMGRHGANLIGAWRADDTKNMKRISTLRPRFGGGLQPITAGGMYGFATRRHLWLEHDYYWATSQPWGPDVNFGIWITEQGYTCFINWDVVFGHNEHGNVAWPDQPETYIGPGPIVEIVYTRDRKTYHWDRRDYEVNVLAA